MVVRLCGVGVVGDDVSKAVLLVTASVVGVGVKASTEPPLMRSVGSYLLGKLRDRCVTTTLWATDP